MPNPKIDLTKIPFYLKIGEDIVHAGVAALADLRKIAADNGADDAQLAKLDALYGDRIAREEAIDAGQPPK